MSHTNLRHRITRWQMSVAAVLLAASACAAQEVGRMPLHEGPKGPPQPVPVFTRTQALDAVLGRPTSTSVVLSLLHYQRDAVVTLVYAPFESKDKSQEQQRHITLKSDEPQEVALSQLKPNTRYSYLVRAADSAQALLEGSFHAARPPGSHFAFTLTADSHLDQNTSMALYQQTLANVAMDEPDFHIDLGDTFMTEKHASREGAAQQYLVQRHFLSRIGAVAPLFLVLGNHDGESAKQVREGADGLAVWANMQRKRYFPNPVPDHFYSGNANPDALSGSLQDYYAWHWGDALLVVLNPYWHAPQRRADERWGLSLGEAQYRWLQKTLETSHAKFKIILIHQLAGGADAQGRGGAEAVPFGEWGGDNADGTPGLASHRPGWSESIHALLLRTGVNAVFHGHDHLFAMQPKDGIVYQEVPQPAHSGRGAEHYGYRSGTILSDSGHLRITVTPQKLVADFVATQTLQDGLPGPSNRKLLFSYDIPAR
jgi:predicted phosphodiesterase